MKLLTCLMGIITSAIIFNLSTTNVASAQSTTVSVDPSNRQASIDFFKSQYKLSDAVTAGWTGSVSTCNPGATSSNYQSAVLRRANYFRAMAGLSLFAMNDTYSSQSQPAALISSANNLIAHAPDPSMLCYSDMGAQAAVRANMALGVHGWDAVTAYMQDAGPGNYAVGHRRWLFYPQTQFIGTGDVPSGSTAPASNALYIVDSAAFSNPRPATRHEFVAWPPPGYVPYLVTFARWSFSSPGANFANATVSMSSNGVSIATAKEPIVNGYGENTLVWLPMGLIHNMPWPRPMTDTEYDVTIGNVVVNGQVRSFNYRVIVVDINEAPTDIKLSVNSVAENKVISTSIGYLSAIDPDTGDTFRYAFVPGEGDTDNAKFVIVSNRLKTNAIFDYETKASYKIRLRVSDGRIGSYFEKAFTISVTNANDKPADILLSNNTIATSLPSKTNIGTLSAVDQDTGNTHRYALIAGGYPDTGKFYVITSTLKSNVVFTDGAKITHTIKLRVYDNAGAYNDKVFNIFVVKTGTAAAMQTEQGQATMADTQFVIEEATEVAMEQVIDEQAQRDADLAHETAMEEAALAALQSVSKPEEPVEAILLPAPQMSNFAPQTNDATLTMRVFLPVVNKHSD